MKPVEDEGLLGSAIALSAGLYSRYEHDFIVAQFPALQWHLRKVKSVHRRLLRDRNEISFRGIDQIANLLHDVKSQRVVFAVSQFGPILASVPALTSIGVKVAGVYWALSDNNGRILESCRAHFIDLSEQRNGLSLIRSMQELHADGYVLALMCDAPGKSRSRYEFLNYTVRCANLIEVYARLNCCAVIPTYCQLLSDAEVSLHCTPPVTDYRNMTQRLLSDLEALIYKDYINYLWSGTSIIFSDSRAMVNGLRCLPDFLDWSERLATKKVRARLRQPVCRDPSRQGVSDDK
jgi:hypothetical protein